VIAVVIVAGPRAAAVVAVVIAAAAAAAVTVVAASATAVRLVCPTSSRTNPSQKDECKAVRSDPGGLLLCRRLRYFFTPEG
jgi:hypothetical protein